MKVRGTREDAGFTLIEVVVVVTLAALVSGVLASAFVATIRAGEDAEGRTVLAHDEDLLSDSFSIDVAAASEIDATAAACAPATTVVRMLISGTEIAYRTGAGHELIRETCGGGTRIVAHNLGDAAPVLTCAGGCGAAPKRVTLSVELCHRVGGLCDADTERTATLVATPRASS